VQRKNLLLSFVIVLLVNFLNLSLALSIPCLPEEQDIGNLENVKIYSNGCSIECTFRQCTEFARRFYFQYYNFDTPSKWCGNGRTYHNQPGLVTFYNKFTINMPRLGDTISFEQYPGDLVGHVAVVYSVDEDSNTISFCQQNWSYDNAIFPTGSISYTINPSNRYITLNPYGSWEIIGWGRPQYSVPKFSRDNINYNAVFGIKDKPLYGQIKAINSNDDPIIFNKIGITGKMSNNDSAEMGINTDYILEAQNEVVLNFNNTFNLSGEYTFSPLIEVNNQNVLDSPVNRQLIFTILENKKSIIIDDSEIESNFVVGGYDLGVRFCSSFPFDGCQADLNVSQVNRNNLKSPGYLYGSILVPSDSEAFAQWNPNIEGLYSIEVFIPGNGCNADIQYEIRPDGTDEGMILSKEIKQNDYIDQWCQVEDEKNNKSWCFTKNGYVSLIANFQPGFTVGFDAVKFEYDWLRDELELYYPFNGNANDESGNGNHGVIHGATLTADKFGNPDSAYYFDGEDDSVEFQITNCDVADNLSISLWVAFHSISSDDQIICSNGGPRISLAHIQGSGDKLKFYFRGPGMVSEARIPWVPALGRFYHITAVYQSSTGEGKLYVDGRLVAKNTRCPEPLYTLQNVSWFIGSWDNRGAFSQATIDDVRIYHRALSDVEIKGLSGNIEEPDAGYIGKELYVDDDFLDTEDDDEDNEYRHIQAAIDHATNKDTINIHEGIYEENINFKGKAITIKSLNPEDPPTVANTIIDGRGMGTVVVFNNCEKENSILYGITIRNGEAENGGGIFCEYSFPTIKNCTIINNFAINGCGIRCVYASPAITQCNISDNFSNEGLGGEGGGIDCSSSSLSIDRCNIYNNFARCGGGISCKGGSSLNITNSTISSNTARYSGGGIVCYRNTYTNLANGIISGNSVVKIRGGGIFVQSDSKYYSTIIINNCTISENSAPRSGGIEARALATKITNCIIWGNLNGNIEAITPSVSYCDIQGGYSIGTNIINIDPLFGNPDEGDYYLQLNSPCINTGMSGDGIPTHDKDGNLRDSMPDIGAYEHQDQDGDGIFTTVDTSNEYSNDFSDGTTSGIIINRGDHILTIQDAADPLGIKISGDLAGGFSPAIISACGGSTITLNAGDEVIITCGSVTVNVISGLVEITFVADDGTTATTSLSSGNSLVFFQDTATFIAPDTNPEAAIVEVNGEVFSIPPGETWVMSEETLEGDLNGDGVVDFGDIQKAMYIYLAIEPFDPIADLNGDGIVNVLDIQEIVKIIQGI